MCASRDRSMSWWPISRHWGGWFHENRSWMCSHHHTWHQFRTHLRPTCRWCKVSFCVFLETQWHAHQSSIDTNLPCTNHIAALLLLINKWISIQQQSILFFTYPCVSKKLSNRRASRSVSTISLLLKQKRQHSSLNWAAKELLPKILSILFFWNQNFICGFELQESKRNLSWQYMKHICSPQSIWRNSFLCFCFWNHGINLSIISKSGQIFHSTWWNKWISWWYKICRSFQLISMPIVMSHPYSLGSIDISHSILSFLRCFDSSLHFLLVLWRDSWVLFPYIILICNTSCTWTLWQTPGLLDNSYFPLLYSQ